MTLSREEYIARSADAILKDSGFDPVAARPGARLAAVSVATVALDAVGAYETYQWLGQSVPVMKELGACDLEGCRECDSVLLESIAAVSKADGTEDQRG